MIAETELAPLSQGPGLAGQDQSPVELLGGERTVDPHLDFTRVEGGDALAADAGHTGEGGAQPFSVGSGKDRFAAGHPEAMHPLVQFDANGIALPGRRGIGFGVHHLCFTRLSQGRDRSQVLDPILYSHSSAQFDQGQPTALEPTMRVHSPSKKWRYFDLVTLLQIVPTPGVGQYTPRAVWGIESPSENGGPCQAWREQWTSSRR